MYARAKPYQPQRPTRTPDKCLHTGTLPADQVEGTEGDASGKLPYPNEPVAEDPPPLPARDLRQARQALAAAMQPGESVTAALRRLAGAGAVMDK